MAKGTAYLALLRGINVGGKNLIPKDSLRDCFERLGLIGVRTYIQSGNVLFRSSSRTGVTALTEQIEHGLSKRFSYEAKAVVIPESRFRQMVEAAPRDWGRKQDEKHNALFLLAGLTSKTALARLREPKPDIERVSTGPGVVFWSISRAKQTQTTYMRLPQEAVYQRLTIRNANTVLRLLAMLEEL